MKKKLLLMLLVCSGCANPAKEQVNQEYKDAINRYVDCGVEQIDKCPKSKKATDALFHKIVKVCEDERNEYQKKSYDLMLANFPDQSLHAQVEAQQGADMLAQVADAEIQKAILQRKCAASPQAKE